MTLHFFNSLYNNVVISLRRNLVTSLWLVTNSLCDEYTTGISHVTPYQATGLARDINNYFNNNKDRVLTKDLACMR